MEAIEDRLAAQWTAYGGQLTGPEERTTVDPDALIAVTAGLEAPDARLFDVAIDWSVKFGRAINTSRLRRVAEEIGVDDAAVRAFGGAISTAGGPRWSFAESGAPARYGGKAVARDVLADSRLAWRVRLAFGVTARADVVTVLLTAAPSPVSVADLARRARHSKRNTANAVKSLGMAGVLDTTRHGNQDRVWLSGSSPLRELFAPDDVTRVDWVSRWRVVWHAARVDGRTRELVASVRQVETRAVVERLLADIEPAKLPRPDTSASGPSWGAAFDTWLEDLANWLRRYSA